MTDEKTLVGPSLSAKGVRKAYPGVLALNGVDLELQPGRIEGLVGKNGAGKSTLINILSGAEPPDSGTIEYDGEIVSREDVRGARERRVFVVRQELELFPDLSIIENLLLPDRFPAQGHRILWRRAAERAHDALGRLGVTAQPTTLVRDLSIPVQRSIMVAQALIREPRTLILDEPTEAFAEKEVDRLFGVVRALAAQGVAVLYVSHRLGEVLSLADHVTVLRDGQTVATLARSRVDRDDLVDAILGPDGQGESDSLPRVKERKEEDPANPADAVLKVSSVSGRRIRDLSLSVRPGEIVGLYGLAGSGRSDALRVIAGTSPERQAGSIWFGGEDISRWSFGKRREAGMVFLGADRASEGLLPELTVRENIVLGSGGLGPRLLPGRLKPRERHIAADILGSVGLHASDLEKPASSLSGGNQQKVLLGRGLASGACFWLLDEPTVGLDVGARRDLFRILRRSVEGELEDAGSHRPPSGALVALSDYDDLVGLVDRVYVLRDGLIVAEFSVREINEERLMHAVSFGST